MKKKTVLVTGGAGYIGSACVKALCDEGYEVVVVDNLSNGDRKYVDNRAIFIEADVVDMDSIESVFVAHKPSVVIHMAGLKAVGQGEENPEQYFRNNVTGTLNVLAAAATYAVRNFIFSSTAVVYKSTEDGLYRETDVLGASNVYGSSKLMAEMLITEFWRTRKISGYTIFRYFNVAGDSGLGFTEEKPQNLVPLLVRSLKEKTTLSVFGNDYPTPDGTCVRDYVHLDDIVRAHMLAIETESVGIFNLGTSRGTSVLEMVAAFEKATGETVPYEVCERRKGDPAVLRAVSEKAKQQLGWEPVHSLESMLAPFRRSV